DAELLRAESVGHRSAARGDEQVLRADLSGLAIRRHRLEIDAARTRLRARHLRPGQNLDALLAERSLELGRHGLVFHRDDAREEFDEGDVAAEAAEDRRELDADGAAAHDRDRLGDGLESDRLVAR